MELKDYKEAVKRTLPELGDKKTDTLHMVLGLVTEVGELTDTHKRLLAYGKEIDKVNEEEEIGDILWYLVNYCNINNIDLEKCMGRNIQKLYKRFPDKFNQDHALVRNLEEERKALEA